MELVVGIELALGAGVGEVPRLVGAHCHEYLHERENAGVHALVCILLDLLAGLPDRGVRPLQLDVDDGHAVYQQHQVAPTLVQHLGPR